MGLAPIDVWLRMLAAGGGSDRIGARYWVRLAWCLFTSALGTTLTLPERAAFAAWWRWRERRSGGDRRTGAEPEVLCILGYYRSGTTHLHYLLSCDPASATPRWYQVLAPQGFILSWALLRWFLIPFLGSTRPQDDVAIGPEWPAEDDFALCNWTLSSPMPGRMVLPRAWEHWKRLHAMEDVTAPERRRWRRAVRMFAWKAWAAAGGIGGVGGVGGGGGLGRRDAGPVRVLLKTPAHTARIREIIEVFGAERVRFVHIARDPAAVVRSNVAMHARFEPFLLQPAADEDEVRRRIVEEYDQTERRFLEQSALIPPGRLARLRYQDLIADPVGQLKRVYAELGLAWSDELASRLARYLHAVADYRAAGAGAGAAKAKAASALPPELAWMNEAFGHDRPAVAKVDLPAAGEVEKDARGDEGAGGVGGELGGVREPLIVALLAASAWIGLALLMRDRLDWLTWPVGVLIGARMRRSAPGSVTAGLLAAALTIGVLAVVAYPATALAFYRGREPVPWGDVWDSTRDGLLAVNNLVWLFLGVMSAYRLASRKQAAAPG